MAETVKLMAQMKYLPHFFVLKMREQPRWKQ